MATSIKLLPGATIRWHRRQYVIVGYAGLDAILGRPAASEYRRSDLVSGVNV
jgi:hypothetical protein